MKLKRSSVPNQILKNHLSILNHLKTTITYKKNKKKQKKRQKKQKKQGKKTPFKKKTVFLQLYWGVANEQKFFNLFKNFSTCNCNLHGVSLGS